MLVYRVIVRLVTGDALILGETLDSAGEAERQVDRMKQALIPGGEGLVSFWDKDGDYVAVAESKILAIYATQKEQ